MNLTEDYVLFTDDCLDINFLFKKGEIKMFLTLWDEGEKLSEIAKKMRRKVSEIALLIIDLDMREKIPQRTRGIHGGEIIALKKKKVNKKMFAARQTSTINDSSV